MCVHIYRCVLVHCLCMFVHVFLSRGICGCVCLCIYYVFMCRFCVFVNMDMRVFGLCACVKCVRMCVSVCLCVSVFVVYMHVCVCVCV